MSRNLGRTNCDFCQGEVVLCEAPRPAMEADTGAYWPNYKDDGFVVANAWCSQCEAKYLAWVTIAGGSSYFRNDGRFPFVDLSFRSTFDDEPGWDDLPTYEVKMVQVRSPFDRARYEWLRPKDGGT